MISNDFDINKAAQVELLRPEHRHDGDFRGTLNGGALAQMLRRSF